MKIESKLNKIYAGAIAIMMITIVFSSIMATRTITDTSDTIGTMITNSKGNSWPATGANLRLAMYDLNTTGGTVYVPVGTFYTPGVLYFYLVNNTKIQGSGPATVLKAANGITAGAGVVLGSSARKINNVTISDLTVDGNSTTDGINFFGSSNITINNVIIRYATGTGLHTQESSSSTRRNCSNILVSNLRVYYTKTYQPIGMAQTYNVVLDNIIIQYAPDAGGQGIDFARFCRNISLNNFYISDCAGGVKSTGLTGTYNSHITISNGNIMRCKTELGIRTGCSQYVTISNVNIKSTLDDNGVSIGVSGEPCKYVEVSNININTTTGIGFVIGSGTSNVNVNNLVVRSSSTRAFSIDTANNCSLNNCKFTSMGTYNYLYLSKYITISNSMFNTGTTYGLDADGSSHFTITGCKFINNVDAAIVTANTCSYYQITDCEFISNAGIGIWIAGIGTADSNFIISDCLFKSNTGDGIDSVSGGANNYTISGCYFTSNAKAIDTKTTDNYRNIHDNICALYTGDVIDLNAATNTTVNLCHDNIAQIVVS